MKNNKKNIPGYLLLIAGVLMMASGAVKGEHSEVFEKAVRICLECIGIG